VHVRACVRELASYALAKVYQNYFADSTACAWVRVCIGGTGSVVGWVCGRLSGTRKQEFGASEIGGIATARSGAQSLSLERTHAHALCFCSSLVTTHALVCARAHTHTHTHTHTHIHTHTQAHKGTNIQTYTHKRLCRCQELSCIGSMCRRQEFRCCSLSLSLSLAHLLARSQAHAGTHSLSLSDNAQPHSLTSLFLLSLKSLLLFLSIKSHL